MPGDRIPVPVVVTAAGPKVETDAAEHLLRRIYFPDGVPSVSGRPRRCCPDSGRGEGGGRARFPYRCRMYIVGILSLFRCGSADERGAFPCRREGKYGIMGNFAGTVFFCVRLL